MAKNEKRISVNAFEQVVGERFVNATEFEWYDITVNVTPTLSLKTMMEFVNDVVGSCFDENGEYRPEIMHFAIKTNILTKYANFRMPSDLSKRYELVCISDAPHAVLEHVNIEQYNEILRAIDRKLRQLSDANVQALLKQMGNITNTFQGLQNQMEELFNGVSNEDVSGLLNAVKDGSVSEEKLVKAYANTMIDCNGLADEGADIS